jgi:hypothetical protein
MVGGWDWFDAAGDLTCCGQDARGPVRRVRLGRVVGFDAFGGLGETDGNWLARGRRVMAEF